MKPLAPTVREHARNRGTLDGADAQALEHALTVTEIERDTARDQYVFMVQSAADQKLEGYRELAARLANAENERDEARRERDKARDEARSAVDEALRETAEAISHAHTMRRQRDAARAELGRVRDAGSQPARGLPEWEVYDGEEP